MLILKQVKKNQQDTCGVCRGHGPGNKKINVGHMPIELSSTLRFFVIHGEENNINLLLRPQINAGTPIKRPWRLFKK